MIKSTLIDGRGKELSAHLHERDNNVGQVVYSDPLTLYDLRTAAFINEANGIQMAISGGFSGTPELVSNGGDTAAWTGSNISGNDVDFTSTERPRTGSASVHVDGPNVGNIWQFDKGSTIDLSAYVAITMWVNVDRRWGNGDDITFFGYNTSTGLQVGDTVLLEDYLNEGDNDVWQEVIIVLEDMNLQDKTIDAFRMSYTNNAGTAPEFFIDDFQIEETTTSEQYKAEPNNGKLFYVNEIRINIVDALNTTLLNSSMHNLSYNTLLGRAELDSGLFLSRLKDEETQFSISYNNLNDFLRRGYQIESAICDGTNTSITLVRKFDEYLILDSKQGDNLSFTVNDDLSGLISLSALALGKETDGV
jgi:hypothetical protein